MLKVIHLTGFPPHRQFLTSVVGKDRVIMGSDYPFPLGESHPGSLIEACGYDTKTKEMMLAQNALDWLGVARSNLE